ncbi:vomeronasal type-2 receptor 116-like [Tenrec ecaudatus]|uniref:vomeronasal type-2 receptor 116-like n=1 Tax=Tenrec ecaudatus TaxID=94439 RepID=UPI003F5A2A3C
MLFIICRGQRSREGSEWALALGHIDAAYSNLTPTSANLIHSQPSVDRDGDLVLGGFFPLYTVIHDSELNRKFFMSHPREMQVDWFNYRGYSYVLAFLFAIEEINRSPHLLPNMSLGFRLYNAYPSDISTLKSALGWLSEGEPPIPNYTCQKHTKSMAVTVALTSEFSMQIGALLELYRTPQIFCGSFDPLLRNKDQFSSLYQMAPKHNGLASGMVSLLIHFEWTWVNILVSDDVKGDQFLWDLRREMAIKGVCMALMEKISVTEKIDRPKDFTNILRILDSSANVVIVYGDGITSIALVLAGDHHLTTHKLHQFLKHTQLENSAGEHVSLDGNRYEMSKYEIFNYWNFPEGFEFHVKVGEFFPQGLHGHSLRIQEELIECAIGFEEMPHSVCSKSCGLGFMRILQEGQPFCCFDCILCPEKRISNQTDSDQCMECPQSQYPNTERTRCLPKSVTFLDYQDPLGMALACTALCFSVVTAMVLGVFVKYRDSPMVKANNRTLSYVLLLSLLLCFLCSFLFIGRPNAVTCILSNISFAVIFTVAVSTVLAKSITVILAFKVLRPGGILRQLLVSGVVNSVIPFCSLIQLIICGIWLGTSPPFTDINTYSEPRIIIIECNKGSVTAFYCGLGYLGSLALGTLFLAYLTRNLPGAFNEAKFLTFSMLVFCSVWVTFLPVYHSTQGKVMVAVEIFSILASSVGLLGCIFAPKCYVIFLHPDGNTSKGLKNKTYMKG